MDKPARAQAKRLRRSLNKCASKYARRNVTPAGALVRDVWNKVRRVPYKFRAFSAQVVYQRSVKGGGFR